MINNIYYGSIHGRREYQRNARGNVPTLRKSRLIPQASDKKPIPIVTVNSSRR
jgi:hypothetical protein